MVLSARNFSTLLRVVFESPGMRSSIETPMKSTPFDLKAPLTARRSSISCTHGTHQVAQMLTTRSFAGGVGMRGMSAGFATMRSAVARKSAAIIDSFSWGAGAPLRPKFKSLQFQSGCLLQVRRVIEHDPDDHRKRQRAVRDQLVVELAEPERGAFAVAIAAEDSLDLPFAGDVADLLGRTRR